MWMMTSIGNNQPHIQIMVMIGEGSDVYLNHSQKWYQLSYYYNKLMKHYFSLFSLLTLLWLSSAQYAPTFPSLVQTGKLLINQNGAIPALGLTITIPFSVDKNTTSYAETISFQNLFLNINNFCYSIKLHTFNKMSNSESILISSNCSCILNWMSIRYLIVQPAFAASVQLVQIEQNYSTPKLLQSSTNTNVIIARSFQGAPVSFQPAVVLKGITIRNNKNGAPNEYIDFQHACVLAANLTITITGLSSQAQIYLQFVSLTVILVQKSISIGNMVSYFAINYLTTSPSASILNNTAIYSDSTTFVGLSKFKNMNSNAFLRYDITINPNTVSLATFNNAYFEIVLINFAFGSCSSLSPYFFPTTASCVSSCPSFCQVNSTAPFLCSPCTNCPNGSFLSNTTCLPCSNSCVTCDSLFNCTSCALNYSLQNFVCKLNCTSLLNSSAVYRSNDTCQACPAGCLLCTNKTYCSSCNSSYFFDNGSCLLNCSLVKNASFLLNGSCLSCNSTCSSCLNSSYCTSCQENYLLSNSSCLLDCSKIQNATYLLGGQCIACGLGCQSCLNASHCTSCNSTWFINGNICFPNCSVISNSTFLLNQSCQRCAVGCASCRNQSICTACSPKYNLTANNSCELDCSLLSNCSICKLLSSNNIFCITCLKGYSASLGVCKSSCGDGYYIGDFQGCDDGNVEKGDGCSQQCRVESDYWNCSSTEGNISLCKLIKMELGPSYLLKASDKNSIIAYISVLPRTGIYSGLNWHQGLSFDSTFIAVQKAYFDSQKQMIVVEAAYTQSLTSDHAASLKLTPSSIALKLDLLPTTYYQIDFVAENHLSLEYFTQEAYSISAFIEYYVATVVCLSYAMFLIGYFGGKVVVIEHFSVYQSCSLSLLTIGEASPAFGALRVLRFSLGNSFFGEYDYSTNLDRSFKGLHFTLNALQSFGIVFFIFLAPILAGGIIKVLSLTLCKERALMKQLPPFFFCQFAFYGILLSSILIYAEFVVCFSSLSNQASDLTIGIIISLFFILAIGLQCFFLKKNPSYFGSFTKSFIKFGVPTFFWIIVLCMNFLHPLFLILLKDSDAAIGVQLFLITLLFVFILVSKPYVDSSYRRQGINFVCTFSVLSFELTGRLANSSQAIKIFLPLVICVILTITLFSNSYYLIQKIKPLLAPFFAPKVENAVAKTSAIDRLFEITKEPDVETQNQKQFELFERKMMGDSEEVHLIMKQKLPVDCSPLKMNKQMLDREWQNYPVLAKSKMLEEIRFKIASRAGKNK